jgi:hypothetical protein
MAFLHQAPRRGLAVILCLSLVASSAFASGKKPKKKKEEPGQFLHDAKDGANEALTDLDRSIHRAIPTVKKGANEALEAVDRGVHKIVDPDRKK